ILSSKLDFTAAKLKKMKLYQLSKDKPLILIGSEARIGQKKAEEFRELGVDLILLSEDHGRVDLEQLLRRLAEREISSLLLEGGSGVYSSFIQAGLVDKLYIFQAPIIIGDDGVGWVDRLGIKEISDAIKLKDIEFEFFSDNLLIAGYPEKQVAKNSTWKG
ncbi:MAG: RibD family protein, partial [Desulfobacterales bacterium]|nr:RibD family protein [Desulfobacterales bacterium]